ncbi:ABC transporter permease [Paenibacillus abyssi]|uniref:ABC transporter permease n=1 Tax=Paenibacillus abyssi TaxID=1340531 RepID=A0A917FQ46_9BACL|nr:ABC transporter permease [Paenibacillus abyssi]GGF98944.1 ABC transporter permease [Paenibacillus abyssi]
MNRSLSLLWQQRATAFRKETIPYIRYMGQSGFPGFVSLLFIVGMIGYSHLLRNMPPSFPIISVGVIVLTPMICWSPFRTWLHPADTVFLMPREKEIGDYLANSWRYNGIPGVIALWALLMLYVPLYVKAVDEPLAWPMLAVVVTVMKGLNAFGAWRERQMAWPGARRGIRLVRWAAAGLMLAAFLAAPLWNAAAFALLLVITCVVVIRLPQRHSVPWERLITEEERTRRRYYRFFSAFIDVPVLPSRIARRGYLSWIANRIRYAHKNTYRYLFAFTLLRTELGGIIMRLTMLGALIVYLTSVGLLLSGWGAVAVHILFVLIIAVQSSSLHQVHRHSVWRHIYPLPEQRHDGSLVRVVVTASAICGGIIWLPLALTSGSPDQYAPALTALIVYLGYVFWMLPARLRRKLTSGLED